MTAERAAEIIADCAYQDVGNEGLEAVLAVDADVAIANWRRYSAEAGDLLMVEAIDRVGLDLAASLYEAALIKIKAAS